MEALLTCIAWNSAATLILRFAKELLTQEILSQIPGLAMLMVCNLPDSMLLRLSKMPLCCPICATMTL